MLKWLTSIKTVRGVKNGQTKDQGACLKVGDDVELKYGWVYYQKPREPRNIMYRNKWYVVDDAAAFQTDNFFIKSYPWEYEREFRIVFRNCTSESYDALFVDIPEEILEVVKVMLAPELQEEQFKKIKGLQCIGSSYRPIYSKLSIRMNLFNRNRGGLLDYLREELAQTNPEIEAENICKVLQDAGRCQNHNG